MSWRFSASMTAPKQANPNGAASADTEVATLRAGASAERVAPLRGASVEADIRLIGRVIVGACSVALAALVTVLFLAGAHKNAQITELRQHGVRVEDKVSRCLGLLGGSGSNAGGYACAGTFMLDGQRYDEAIPGDTLRAPGAILRAVAVPGDPPLVSTVRALQAEHSSWRVFILPTVLLVVLLLLVATLALRPRRALRASARSRSVTEA